jgi:hypothetical protein
LLSVAVVAAVVLTRPEDDGSDERRAAVAGYIVQVNTTQQALVLELGRVNVAYRELELKGDPDPVQLRRVEGAERSLAELRDRFKRLSVPPEAARLHAELLRLVELQVAFAREVAGMVRYLPVQAEEGRAVIAATNRLRGALEAGTAAETQRVAFERYRQSVRAVVRRLEQTPAPAVLEPARAGEIARLKRLDTLAGQVGRALADQQVDAVERLFAAFVRESADTGTTPAERQAVIAYNRRLAAITEQRAAVTKERARLDLELQ